MKADLLRIGGLFWLWQGVSAVSECYHIVAEKIIFQGLVSYRN